MAIQVEIKGKETFILRRECMKRVEFRMDTPLDSTAKAKDMSVSMILSGRILADAAQVGQAADTSAKLEAWSRMSDKKQDAYRDVTVSAVFGDQTVRQYHFEQAFVVDYYENYSNQEGVGEFVLILKERKSVIAKSQGTFIKGGFKGIDL